MLVLVGLLFIGGILISGAEGPYFPWLNYFGAVMAGIGGLIANNLRS